MQLTTEQLDAIRNGESVRLQVAGTSVVVMQADVYERLQFVLSDSSGWLDDAMYLPSPENADLPGWQSIEVCETPDSQS
jgi:hypothetical protein